MEFIFAMHQHLTRSVLDGRQGMDNRYCSLYNKVASNAMPKLGAKHRRDGQGHQPVSAWHVSSFF